jgi:HEAT repeat protein
MAIFVTMLLSGFFLDLFPKPSEGGTYLGYMILFGIGTLMGCLDVVLHTAIPEPPMESVEKGTPFVRLILAPLKDRSFLRLSLIGGAFTFGALMVNPFGVVYCLEDLGMSWSFLVSFLSAVNLPFAVLGSFAWGWMAQRYGFRPVLIVTSILGVLNLMAWFLVSATPVTVYAPGVGTMQLKMYHLILPLMNVVGGFVWSGHALAMFNLLIGLSPSRGKAVYLASYATIVGVFSALGPFIAGMIVTWAKAGGIAHPFYLGVTLNYWHILLGITAVVWTILIGFMFTIERPQESPVGFFVGQIVRGNPLRAFYIMATAQLSTAPEKRARAMRSLGETGSSLAVGELLAHLDDPDPGVREEAVRSLGKIRDTSAVAALAARLRDPEGDLRVLSARSLGMIGGKEAVEVLVEQMRDPSREVRLEAVRALGDLAPPAAQQVLLELLASEEDLQVRAAASTALSRMRNVDAVWEMIEVFRLAENSLVRAQVAIAIGQILNHEGDFYPLYRGEQRLRGSQVSRLIGRLRGRLTAGQAEGDARATARTLRRIESAYIDGNWNRCARLLTGLVLNFACRAHGLPENAPEPVFYLLARDWRLAACLHYLETLSPGEGDSHLPSSDLEILLGVYFFWQVVRSPDV